MNEETKQILKNQKIIMGVLTDIAEDYGKPGFVASLESRINETKELINPKEEKSLPEKTKDALEDNFSKEVKRIHKEIKEIKDAKRGKDE